MLGLPVKKIPLIEFTPDLINPSEKSKEVKSLFCDNGIRNGYELAACFSENGHALWIFYESQGNRFIDDTEIDRDKRARTAAFRAIAKSIVSHPTHRGFKGSSSGSSGSSGSSSESNNCTIKGRIFIPGTLLGDDTFVQVGEVYVSNDGLQPLGKVTRFYTPRQFKMF